MTGINLINKSHFDFAEQSDGKLGINLVGKDAKKADGVFLITHESFLAGDLMFLAMIMGKEGFSMAWCNWCKLSKAEWQCFG